MRNYLVSLRKEKGLTQKQMAEKLDISESYYNQIENGERQRKMDISLVSKISIVLGITVSDLIDFENEIQEDTQ